MYWFRVDTPWVFAFWLAISGVWALGGWLLATHTFRLESRERVLVAFGLGLVCYLWFANLLGHWLPPMVTFTAAAFVVLALGLAFGWRGERPWLDWKDLRSWRWILVGLILVWLFTRLARGMAIFDDRKNISIVSTMAAGDIPPHHYMNSAFYFAYHYGFQLLGASLMRLGGLLPWSAFDLSKAMTGAYLFILAALLGKRYIEHPLGAAITAGVLAFATGTRYLLLLAPAALMARIDPLITVRSPDEMIGLPLSQAILQGLVLKDGPPAPFPYAFMNGIGWPTVMAVHAGPSTMSLVILLLLWLLASRIRTPRAVFVLTILLSYWAMVWESSYALFLIAGLSVGLYWLWGSSRKVSERWKSPGLILMLALFLSLLIALLQGGTLTEVARKILVGGTTPLAADDPTAFAGFSLRWPPAIYSGHLGALSIFSPLKLLLALCELGPVVLFAPWIARWAWRRTGTPRPFGVRRPPMPLATSSDWMPLILSLSAWLGVLLPIFFSYEYDRDIVRFTKHGTLLWTLMLSLMVWERPAGWGKNVRILAVFVLALTVFGGIIVTGSELSAAGQTMLTEGNITTLDARLAADVWDELPTGSEVFDPDTWRATMLTGRLTHVVVGNMSYNYQHSPEWEQLRQHPTPQALLVNGFRYIYLDEVWWSAMPQEARASLSQPCVRVVSEHHDSKGDHFRRLMDVEACK